MGPEIKLVACFVFACVFTGLKGDSCEAFDENGLCVEPCPADTNLYVTDCWNSTMSQSTCSEPEPHALGIICGYRRCDCRAPKVFDKVAKKCVNLEDCADPSDAEGSDE